MQSKVRQELVQAFISALQEDTIPWHRCWNADRPVSLQTGKAYRGVNNILLSYIAMGKGYVDPRWMTFKQAQEHGWKVRKGEQAARVEFWHYYDKQSCKTLDNYEVRRIQREQPERMKYIRLAAFTYAVFNAEQVEGVPELKRPEAGANLAQLKSGRDILLANLGVEFREGGDQAYYNSVTDSIILPRAESFTSDYAYVCTLLHEVGHATGHESRLNRPMGARFGSSDYAKEELRAEIASAFTAQALGLRMNEQELKHSIDQHKAYIQSWISALQNEPNELFTAIKDADKITDYLLETGKVLELALGNESSRKDADRPEQQLEGLEEWEP